MASLVDDLLLLARLDEGRPLERARRSTSACSASTPPPTRARSRPTASSPPRSTEGVTVDGDEDRLRQVVGNLVGNALVHTPAGTAVSVRVHNGGGRAVVEVHDDGPGMTDGAWPRGRSSGSRGPTRRVRATRGGAGLGLAIVQAIVVAHGGDVRLSSSAGRRHDGAGRAARARRRTSVTGVAKARRHADGSTRPAGGARVARPTSPAATRPTRLGLGDKADGQRAHRGAPARARRPPQPALGRSPPQRRARAAGHGRRRARTAPSGGCSPG